MFSHISYLNLTTVPIAIYSDEKRITKELYPTDFVPYRKIAQGYHMINIIDATPPPEPEVDPKEEPKQKKYFFKRKEEENEEPEPEPIILCTKKINIRPHGSYILVICPSTKECEKYKCTLVEDKAIEFEPNTCAVRFGNFSNTIQSVTLKSQAPSKPKKIKEKPAESTEESAEKSAEESDAPKEKSKPEKPKKSKPENLPDITLKLPYTTISAYDILDIANKYTLHIVDNNNRHYKVPLPKIKRCRIYSMLIIYEKQKYKLILNIDRTSYMEVDVTEAVL
ncbi:MAG: hypothetical protein BEN18_03170 [Epulopiscium sp. Nuni2H_MBin001]|nr:MAG: hypothetical protein BEN18_03170 [Epulopiscium sp. Nuni2H_MBin001]